MHYHLHASGELAYTTDDNTVSERYTKTPPPEIGSREVALYRDGAWAAHADWRGVALYDTATGEPARILSVGATPEEVGFTTLKPPPLHVWNGEAWVPPTTQQYEATVRGAALLEVDAVADECRLKVAGDPLRVVEYQRAADEAQHFLDSGEALPTVTAWAAAKGWSNQQAAENILGEARAWNGVLYAIRDIRLEAKELIRTAPLEQVTSVRDSAKVALRNLISGVGNATPT